MDSLTILSALGSIGSIVCGVAAIKTWNQRSMISDDIESFEKLIEDNIASEEEVRKLFN